MFRPFVQYLISQRSKITVFQYHYLTIPILEDIVTFEHMHGVTPHHDLILIIRQSLTELFVLERSIVLDLFEVIALECPLFSTCLFYTIVNERMRTYGDEVEYYVLFV